VVEKPAKVFNLSVMLDGEYGKVEINLFGKNNKFSRTRKFHFI